MMISIALTIACNTSTQQPEDRKPVSKNIYAYKGNIKTVNILSTRYSQWDNIPQDTIFSYQYDSFDTDGNIVKSAESVRINNSINGDTAILLSTTQDHRINKTTRYLNGIKRSDMIYTWTNDTSFRVQIYEQDSLTYSAYYTLNSKYLLVKKRAEYANGKTMNIRTTHLYYNDNNEQVSEKYNDSMLKSEKNTDITIISRDKFNNPTSTKSRDKNDPDTYIIETKSYTYY